MMRLRLSLLQKDLVWRFQVSDTTASKVITTLLTEFSCLIIWPYKGQIYATLPICFKKCIQRQGLLLTVLKSLCKHQVL